MLNWITHRKPARPERDVLVTDFGNVIVDRRLGNVTPEAFLKQGPLPYAIDGLTKAVEKLGPERVYIVSRVDSDEIGELYFNWLITQDIAKKTGLLIDKEHVRFCADRTHKGAICYTVGATIVVDDRTLVLWSVAKTYGVRAPAHVDRHLQSVNKLSGANHRKTPPWLRLFSFNASMEDQLMLTAWYDGIKTVSTWKEVAKALGW